MHIPRIHNASLFLRRHGLADFLREIRSRLDDAYHEHRLGIHTSLWVPKLALGIENPDSVDYVPTPYAAIYSMLGRMPFAPSKSVFLDLGCGKGRAVAVAATFPFERIIGIELSEQLAELAEANIASLRHRRAKQIEIHHMDATAYEVPPEVNVIYFFNPFIGKDLRKVVSNIHRSYVNAPRPLFIIFFTNVKFDEIVHDQPWITKTCQMTFHPRIRCGLYGTAPPAG
jgi:SAM-dependent methyltransferase